MKRSTIHLAIRCFACIISGLCVPKVAQGQTPEKGFQISIGTSLLGPTIAMANYLADEDYDVTQGGFFGPISYPLKQGGGIALTAGYRWAAPSGTRSYLAEAGYTALGDATGVNGSGDRINVSFRSITLGVSGIWEEGTVEFGLGPVLLFNTAFDYEEIEDSQNSINTAIAGGLKGSMDIRIWKSKATFGMIGVSGVLTHNTKMGPFPIQNRDSAPDLDATGLNFSHITFRFMLGFLVD